MNPNEARRALRLLAVLCILVLLIAAVYFLAEYRADTKGFDPRGRGLVLTTEPVETNGIEGVMTAGGFYVTALDRRQRLTGLQPGDTILSVGGEALRDPNRLRWLPAGSPVTVSRGGQRVTLQYGATMAGPAPTPPPLSLPAGIDVRGLEGTLTARGLWVEAVDGEARAWGLRRGDLLRGVNGQPLTAGMDATNFLSRLDARTGLTFEVVRNGSLVLLPFGVQPAGAAAPWSPNGALPNGATGWPAGTPAGCVGTPQGTHACWQTGVVPPNAQPAPVATQTAAGWLR